MESKSPDGAKAKPEPMAKPERPMSACSRMNQQAKEEFRARRMKHAKRLSTKIGKSFQQLESSLPEQFTPKERTKEAILEQTRKYTEMMESQLNAAPVTALCLICNKPRIACGCKVPDFLRNPVEQVDRRVENYYRWQMRQAQEDAQDELSE